METLLKEHISQRLDKLPVPALKEVLKFIENVSQKTVFEDDPILSVAGILSGDGLSSKEIETELYGQEILQLRFIKQPS